MKALKTLVLLTFAASPVLTASAATLTLTALDDTYLRASVSDSNFGGHTQVLAGTLGNSGLHALFRFNLNQAALSGATITSATLKLYSDGNDSGSLASATLNLFQLAAANAGWVEGTGAGSTGEVLTGVATWNHQVRSTTPWAGTAGASTPGTDYINTSLGSFTGNPQTITAGTEMNFTSGAFAGAVAGNIGGALNLWVGSPEQESGSRNFFRIATVENATVANHPTLIIEYTPIPEPSATLMFAGALGLLASRRRSRS